MSNSAGPEKRKEVIRERRGKSVSGIPMTLSDIREVSGPSGDSDNRTTAVTCSSEAVPRKYRHSTGDDKKDSRAISSSPGQALSLTAPNSCQNSDTDSDSDLDETARMHQRLFRLQKQQEELDRQLGTDPSNVVSLAVPAVKPVKKLKVRRKSSESRKSSEGEMEGDKSGRRSRGNSVGQLDSGGESGGSGSGRRVRRRSSGGKGYITPDHALKRVPSSLFYIDYDAADEADDDDSEEDYEDNKGSLTPDIPSSRKISAVQYVGFIAPREEGPKRTLGPFLGSQSKSAFVDICYTDRMKEIDIIMKPFRMNDDQYKEVTELLGQALDRGLSRETNSDATVKMYPTYVRALPTGTESGRFLALDLGGTNFRILLVDLKGRDEPGVISKQFLVPNKIMRGTGRALFDHIVQCIADFLGEHGLKSEKHALGFTFSFACAQVGLASARLVRWSKGFCCSGVEGQDVVELLHDAVRRRGDIQIECFGILNDNVGVLMTAARSDPKCLIGLILGTGTNCCYMENLDKVELWDGDNDEPRQVIINTEWGAFGDDGCLDSIRNSYDVMVDEESLNHGRHLYEKMISGMYMGEIVRFVLCDLANKGLLFEGNTTEELNEPYRFYTKYISEIESDDPTGEFLSTKAILEELSLSPVTMDDCRLVRHVCWQVSQRAAHLAGAGVAAVINRLERNDVTVAVDGSLYRFHPHFKDLMSKKISQLICPWQQFKMVLAHDGSGQGAAIVAAVARKYSEEKCTENKDLSTETEKELTKSNISSETTVNDDRNGGNCSKTDDKIKSELAEAGKVKSENCLSENTNKTSTSDKSLSQSATIASSNEYLRNCKALAGLELGNTVSDVSNGEISSSISETCAFASSAKTDNNEFGCKLQTIPSRHY